MSFNTTFVQVTSVYSLQTVSCGPKSSGISKQGQDDTKAFRFPYQKRIEERKKQQHLVTLSPAVCLPCAAAALDLGPYSR